MPRSDPPLRTPAARRVRPIRRPWLLAALGARAAVLARTPLEEYLGARLALYQLRLPIPRSRLPLRVEVAGGEILSSLPGPQAGSTSPGEALVALEGPSALRESTALEAHLAALEAEREAAQHRLEGCSRGFDEDLAAGRIAPTPTLEHSAEELGRPPVRDPGAQLGLALAAVVAVLAAAWSVAVPALAAAGRYPIVLDDWLRPEVVQATFACTFALGVSLGLLALALVGLRTVEAFSEAVGASRRRWAQATALLAGLAATAAVAGAATLPAPRSGLPPPSHAVLLLAVSAGAAFLLRRAGRLRDERAGELAAALAWDRERARALGARARRLEELGRAEEEVRRLDQRRARIHRRLDELARRSADAVRLIARVEETERADRERLARSLLAALERDRWEFLRQATARGATDLLPGPWVPVADPRVAGSQERPAPGSGRLAG